MEKVAFSPKEFAALFNKEQTWGYRQIYAGTVETITEYGRILVPASEVEKILSTAGRYEGLVKKARTKKDFEKLKPEIQDAWSAFVRSRGQPGAKSKSSGKVQLAGERGDARRAMLKRLFKK